MRYVLPAALLAFLLAAGPATKMVVTPLTQVPLLLPKESRHMGGGKWRPAECEAASKWFAAEFKDKAVAFGGKLTGPPLVNGDSVSLPVAGRNFKAINLTWESTFTLTLKDPGLVAYAKNLKPGDDLNGTFIAASAAVTFRADENRATIVFDVVPDKVLMTFLK